MKTKAMTVPVLAAMLALGSAAEGSIASWGYNLENQVTDTPAGVGYQAIAAGYQHSLALIPEPETLGLLGMGLLTLLYRGSRK